MCIEDVNHYVWNTWQIGKTYLPLKKKCPENEILANICQPGNATRQIRIPKRKIFLNVSQSRNSILLVKKTLKARILVYISREMLLSN